MIKRFITLFLFAVIGIVAFAQSYPAWYAVYLSNKASTPYNLQNPQEFLSERAIQNRQKNFIAIDSSDLPVDTSYLRQVDEMAKVKYSSRWQNSLLAEVQSLQDLQSLQGLAFVDSVQYLGPVQSQKKPKTSSPPKAFSMTESATEDFPVYGGSRSQNKLLGLHALHQSGFLGKGVKIAVLDGGFRKVNQMDAFGYLYFRNAISLAYDVVNPGNDIYSENSHGTHVLSTIAGILEDKYFGSGPHADFILLRTEDVNSEYPVEEYYWLVGAELADSSGCDMITSSLSYNEFDDTTLNYTHAMLDGKSTIVSRAAQSAAEKGMLVLTSAGNNGQNTWRKIGFPADAASAIAVGAVDSLGNYAKLSAVGYNALGRVKPDMVAVGQACALISTNDKVFFGNGTSFSTPTICGAFATLMSAHPHKSMKEIKEAVYKSCQQYNKPDSLLGYGIPDFYVAHMILSGIPQGKDSTFSFQVLPNPFPSGFYLLTQSIDSQEVHISIYDLSGKEVYHSIKNLQAGTQAIYMHQLSALSNGVYVVKVKTEKESYTQKIIKQE